jgi:lipoprotein-releasing system permease protein
MLGYLNMSFPWFISKKYVFSKKDSRFINFISIISIIGITLGVTTLIISLCVLNGFEKTLTDKIVDFDSHIQITSFTSTLPNQENALPELKNYLRDFNPSITPFASKLVIISSKKSKEGINLIGISPDSPRPGFIKDIVKGDFALNNVKVNPIIIGKKLADKLFLNVGDETTIFSLKNDQIPSPENLPNIEKFKVTGIFESAITEYDDTYAYTNLSIAQKLFSIGDKITGYNIKLGKISKIDSLTYFLGKKLRYPHRVRSIYQIHRNIFTWIELQKKPIPIVLGLIIIVAVFNIIGTLLMVVLEKTNSIGVLKSLGAKKNQIVKIFIIQGILLALAGILFGNILATILMELQLEFNIITLPSSVYFMSKVPILMKPEIFIVVSLITFFLCIAASAIPSFVASRIRPVDSLRFN